MRLETRYAVVLAVSTALALAACKQPDLDTGTEPGLDCPLPGPAYLLWTGRSAAQIGDQIRLSPYHSERPGMMEELPEACLSNVTVSPEEAARIERTDSGGTLIVIEQAARGPVAIQALYAGEQTLSAVLDIYDPAEAPLAGYWRQPDEACPGSAAISEVVFRPGGEFSVTWMPFEAYKDYWGVYTYEPGSGTLTLRPEGGNYVPRDVASGTIGLEGETMTLEGASFGSPPQGPRCDAPFHRYRLP